MDFNSDGVIDLLVGTENGFIPLYTGSDNGDSVPLLSSEGYLNSLGYPIAHYQSSPCLYDYDSDGNVVSGWPKVLDRPGSHEDLYAMTVDPSGVACLTGTTDAGANEDVLTVKYDADGVIIGASVYNGADNDDDTPTAIASNMTTPAAV